MGWVKTRGPPHTETSQWSFSGSFGTGGAGAGAGAGGGAGLAQALKTTASTINNDSIIRITLLLPFIFYSLIINFRLFIPVCPWLTTSLQSDLLAATAYVFDLPFPYEEFFLIMNRKTLGLSYPEHLRAT